MRCGNANPHRHVAQLQVAKSMHAQCLRDAEPLAGLGDDALALTHAQRLECPRTPGA